MQSTVGSTFFWPAGGETVHPAVPTGKRAALLWIWSLWNHLCRSSEWINHLLSVTCYLFNAMQGGIWPEPFLHFVFRTRGLLKMSCRRNWETSRSRTEHITSRAFVHGNNTFIVKVTLRPVSFYLSVCRRADRETAARITEEIGNLMKEIETLVEEKKKDSSDMTKNITPQESKYASQITSNPNVSEVMVHLFQITLWFSPHWYIFDIS